MKDNVLKIILWGDEVGKIYWDSKNMTSIFNYNPDFVKKGLDIAPFTASIHSPLGKGHPYVSPSLKFEPKYKGLPYFLSDSLPEKWGTTLFNCWKKSKGYDYNDFSPVDRLAFTGKRAMGAFEFLPDTYPWNKNSDINLIELYDLASRIYKDKEDTLFMPDDENLLAGLCEIGTSAGGQHSKAVIAINEKTKEIRSGQIELSGDFKYYILKFAEGVDFPLANIEMAYYKMAVDAGIHIMPSQLLHINGKSHFLTERFDRIGGKKIFTQTLSALAPDVDSYEELFMVCDKLKISEKQKEELFRRTVFNLFTGNIDDHARNFSFMMNENGIWSITPAYDLIFTADLKDKQMGNYHYFSLQGKNTGFTVDDLKVFAENQGIKRPNAIIEKVFEAITNFHKYAKEVNVGKLATDRIEKFIASIMPVEYGKRMNHYLGNQIKSYINESGFEIQNVRITETDMGDFEIWALINEKRVRAIIDGEHEDGIYIKDNGGNNMNESDIKRFVTKYLLPKAEKERDKLLMYKIKDVNLYNNNTMIRCKVDGNWLLGKKIKTEDVGFEDEYELAFKYFKNEIMELENKNGRIR